MNITVAGIGYVGLSNAIALAQSHHVTAVDLNPERVVMVNNKLSPIIDTEIEDYLTNKELNLRATTDSSAAYTDADYVIVATPTNYDTTTGYFDTSSVEEVIASVLAVNAEANIIIKSTVPVGFTETMRTLFKNDNILFSPEFLREGKALHDNLYPSRIIIGDEKSEKAKQFASLLEDAALKQNIPVLYMSSTEAEAVKLFANTYLAMRVAFFNELDTYGEMHGLNSSKIISGISLDPRIGDHYNNPSFGYGGYCLPKDTKQLVANYRNIPAKLIPAIVASNETRVRHIADRILEKKPRTVGIHRLTMKTGSDNFRQSSVQGVIAHLQDAGLEVIIYEPVIDTEQFNEMPVYSNLSEFKSLSDIIVSNRLTEELIDVKQKVYTRDLFARD